MGGKFALIIGNTQYTDAGLAQLSAPGKDAEDFGRILKDPSLCGFDDVKISLNQLSSSVIETIDEFFDQKKPDDLLVLYFSGHGIRDEIGSLYLAFKNTMRSRLRSTAVKADYVREAMEQSRSRRQVLILDCCNSGAFPQGTKSELGGSMGMVTAFQGYGRYVLTASDATQFAWEGDRVIGNTENSLFTHFLVKGLEGEADIDGDGRITVDDLYDYAFEELAKVTPNQTPTKSASKQAGEIVLRQITRIEDTKPISLPDDLLEALEDLRPFVREVAVQQLAKLLNGRNLGRARSAKEALEKMASEDDSYRVRQAALQVLAPLHEAEQQAEVERKAKVEAERLAAEKVREERLAREKAEAELEKTELQRRNVEREIAALKRSADLDERYRKAVDSMGVGQWAAAQRLLIGIQSDEPGYLDTQELLRRTEAEISRLEEQRQQRERIDALYQQARGSIHAHQWTQALSTLEDIRTLDGQFVDADGIADKARAGLERQKQAAQRQEMLSALYAKVVRTWGDSAPWQKYTVGGVFAVVVFLFVWMLVPRPGTPFHAPPGNLQAVTDRLYFTSDRESNKAEIYDLNLGTGQLDRVTNTPGQGRSWSPLLASNGGLYFTSDREDNKAEIYSLNLTSGKVDRVTNTPARSESWSPFVANNGRLYFTSDREGNRAEIYQLNLTSGQINRVTNSVDQTESWAPFATNDGTLYFTSDRQDHKVEIYKLNLSSGKVDRVTSTPGEGRSWSPFVASDGKLYFTSDREDDRPEIYRLNLRTGQVDRMTHTPGLAGSWSPFVTSDGRLYFTSDREDYKAEIYELDSRTGEVIQFSHTPVASRSWLNVFYRNALVAGP